MLTNLSFNQLTEIINNLPEIESIKVLPIPTGFSSNEILIKSTEPNWKEKIINQCKTVCNEHNIIDIRFGGYYGEKPKIGNKYYIQLHTQKTIDFEKRIRSGYYGNLD